MRKSIIIVPIILVAAIAVWSPRLTGDNTKRKISIESTQTDQTTVTNGVQPGTTQDQPTTSVKQQDSAPKEEIPQVDPSRKEIIVEGTVDKVDNAKHSITFSQELDDNSKKIDPEVIVKKDALIKNGEGKISFEAIKAGDYVIMVIDASGQARAVELN